MSALNASKRYFDAWNARSPEAIVAAVVPGGTYEDPLTGGPLTGNAIGQYAAGLFSAFPDLSFSIVGESETPGNGVSAQWIMRGTNTGSLQGAPPTGLSVELPGADFLTTKDGLVESIKGYFDSAVIPRQLGMQVIVQPAAIGPVQLGTSVYMALGNTTRPAAMGITSLRVRSDADVERVRALSQQILQELPSMKGFISVVTGHAGSHMFTISAWESIEDLRQLHGGAHQDAMDAFYGPDMVQGGVTGVWVPRRLNVAGVRCTECGEMSATEGPGSQCRAGHTLPDPTPFW